MNRNDAIQPGRSRRGFWIVAPLVLGAIVSPSGCALFEKPAPVRHPVSSPGVKLGGDGQQLGEAQRPALTREGFVHRFNELLAQQQMVTARCLVERYPDVALDVLRSASTQQAGERAFQNIAHFHDDQCGRTDPQSGWLALLQDRTAHPDRYAAHDAARQQVQDRMRVNRFKEASEVHLAGLTKDAPGPALEIEDLQLNGEALLKADRPKEAAAAFTQAVKLAQSGFRYECIELLLLLSDAERRSGREEQASAAWRAATETAANLLLSPHPVLDPGLWERISSMRPATLPWPTVVAQSLGPVPVHPDLVPVATQQAETLRSAEDEATLWAAIGQWRLRRNEAQAALLAFKHAETSAIDRLRRDRCQLGQARALAQLDQHAAALAILSHLSENTNQAISQPALAVLGAMLFQQGRNEQALAALRKAVGTSTDMDWPGRAQAEADLGLACLTAGEEADGLRWLHSAQQRFESTGEHELLQQCMWNEATYLDHQNRADEAKAVRYRSQKLEEG